MTISKQNSNVICGFCRCPVKPDVRCITHAEARDCRNTKAVRGIKDNLPTEERLKVRQERPENYSDILYSQISTWFIGRISAGTQLRNPDRMQGEYIGTPNRWMRMVSTRALWLDFIGDSSRAVPQTKFTAMLRLAVPGLKIVSMHGHSFIKFGPLEQYRSSMRTDDLTRPTG